MYNAQKLRVWACIQTRLHTGSVYDYQWHFNSAFKARKHTATQMACFRIVNLK